ncbi:hypothetical protein [Paraferrimonas sp. SM1919]|uniref:hypothetical protein n=1 Tax=Paraferrimonas sp. SM1919 TaxID=2662263 RepID=UPI0013D032A3|nr:hypothetical protein [Paraferrimonas sp. SM1919]
MIIIAGLAVFLTGCITSARNANEQFYKAVAMQQVALDVCLKHGHINSYFYNSAKKNNESFVGYYSHSKKQMAEALATYQEKVSTTTKEGSQKYCSTSLVAFNNQVVRMIPVLAQELAYKQAKFNQSMQQLSNSLNQAANQQRAYNSYTPSIPSYTPSPTHYQQAPVLYNPSGCIGNVINNQCVGTMTPTSTLPGQGQKCLGTVINGRCIGPSVTNY